MDATPRVLSPRPGKVNISNPPQTMPFDWKRLPCAGRWFLPGSQTCHGPNSTESGKAGLTQWFSHPTSGQGELASNPGLSQTDPQAVRGGAAISQLVIPKLTWRPILAHFPPAVAA